MILSALIASTALSGSPTLQAGTQDPGARPSQTPRAPILDHHQMQLSMARLASEHPDLVTILPVGVSRAGRKIDALRLAASERKPGRPAILLVANIDGPWVWTSGLALDHAQKLAESYPGDAKIKALLDGTTIYVIPRANPDAAEARFARPLALVRASGAGVDNDRDGRFGEDPPSDVDDDGLVVMMRVPHPDGEWMPDPADLRATIKADRKKGQRGIWKLMSEGRDSDKDEKAAEDAELDAVVNANFPHGYREHEPESGLYATSEPEARALCDFVLAHKDIALVVTYGAQDNLVEKPKTVKDDAPRNKLLPPEGTLESDGEIYAEIGKRYKKLTDGKARGDNDEHGSFQAWCQNQRGLWCIDEALWSIPLDEDGKKDEAKKDETKQDDAKKDDAKDGEGKKGDAKKDEDKPTLSDDAKRLRWIDAKGESARFVPWKKIKHPELGDVEIGGFAPYALVEPPESARDALADPERQFLASLGELLPRIQIAECKAKDLGGVWEIKAAVEDPSFLPLQSAAARRSDAVRPARVTLRVPPSARILAGNKQELVDDLPGSGGRKELRWLVHGAPPSAIEIEVDTDSAGTARATPEVK